MDRTKNPVFKNAEAEFYLAYKDGRETKERFIKGLNEKLDETLFLPWIIGGLGTATLSNKSHAKSLKTCSLKCPTFNEV